MVGLKIFPTFAIVKVCVKIIQLLWIIALSLTLPACLTSRHVNYGQERAGVAQYEPDTSDWQDYKIQRGDLLRIRVFSTEEDASAFFPTNQQGQNTLYTYQVYEDGTIDLPFSEPLLVQGYTLREARDLVEEELKKLFSDVSVTLTILNKTFCIIGESGSGRFSMPKEKINIYQALAMAGDLSTWSDKKHIKIVRQLDTGETKVFSFDVRSKSIVDSEFYYIQPNDVIYVPYLNQKTFGVTHVTGLISTVLATISLATTITAVVLRIKNSAGK